MNLTQVAEAYLEHLAARPKGSQETVKTYRSVFKSTWEMAQEIGLELDAAAVDETWGEYVIEWMGEQRGLKPATIRRNVGALCGLFKFAKRRKWVRANPFEDIELPEKTETDRVQLTLAQLNALEGAAGLLPREQDRVMARALLLVEFAIGARVSELRALQPGDIDFDAGVVKIRKGKGGKHREVPLGTRAASALRQWLAVRRLWLDSRKGDRRVRGQEPTSLWLADRGRALSALGVARLYDELSRLAGIEVKFRTHDLRALASQNWKRQGVPDHIVQVWLGHTDPSTTRIYTRNAAPDTRRWGQFCGLPPQESPEPTPFGPEEGDPQPEPAIVAAGPSSTAVTPPAVARSPFLDAVRALQALQALQQEHPLLQELLGAVTQPTPSPVIAPAAAPQP
jgi:integrase/recombinase XerC